MATIATNPIAAETAAPVERTRSGPVHGDLVDETSGIVVRAWHEQLPSFGPPGLRLCLAQLAPTGGFGSPLGSDTTAGTAWWDDDAARAAALGEAVEWYCASLVPADLLRATPAELDPRERIDVGDLALYAAGQLAAAGFPFVGFPADVPVRWARGHRLDGTPCLVPASVVYLGYGSGPTRSAPLANLPVNAGLGAHRRRSTAVAAALAEVVERDALAEAWTFGIPLDPIAVPGWFELELGAGPDTRWWLYRLPTRVDVPGVLAVVHHGPGDVFGVGSAVRADAETAARKAIGEAMLAASGCIEIQRADSRRCARLIDDDGPLSPWRPDRCYRASYRDDWRDAVDIACHAQVYVDPAMQAAALDRFAALAAGRAAVPLDAIDGRSLDLLGADLCDAGFEPVLVDVTTPDAASLGWTVQRAVVPGMRATGPAAFPYLGETRHSRPHPNPSHTEPVPHV